jgi:hypothetical protein
MLFYQFASQQERRDFGGSDFLEIQYCRLPAGTPDKERTAQKNIRHWQDDSLYVADVELFYQQYGEIFCLTPSDLYACRDYAPSRLEEIICSVEQRRPPEAQTLLEWLGRAGAHNGFYLLGI